MSRWIVLALALLCFAQVWSKPADQSKDSDPDYQDDDDLNEQSDVDTSESSSKKWTTILSTPKDIRAFVGDTVYLPCETKDAEEVATQWLKNSQVLFMDDEKLDKNSRISRLGDNTLVIENVESQDSSDFYVCECLVSSNNSINPKVTHRLYVASDRSETPMEDKKKIILTPSDVIDVDTGANLVLGCEVQGFEPISIAWSRQGQRIHLDKYISTAAYIKIHNATRHAAGDYQCVIQTSKDEITPTVKHLHLKVRHVPAVEFEKEEEPNERKRIRDSFFTDIGLDANVTCMIHSHPPLKHLDWFKDGKLVYVDHERITKHNRSDHGHVLSIKRVTADDLGDYVCKAKNEIGESTGPMMHLKNTPNHPVWIQGKSVDSSIQFDWKVISYRPIVEIELKYRKEGSTEWMVSKDVKVVSQIGKEHIIRGNITGIEPGNHEALVRARNDEEHAAGEYVQWGPYSDIKKFDGEYKETEPESVRDSAMRANFNLMSLLLIIAPLTYITCL